MVYLECVCKVFQKYCVSFKLEKYDFLKEMVKYVGRDVNEDVNFPAQYKFDLINNWKLPSKGQALFSFIGLINFYHRYDPYFVIQMKPLNKS